VLGFRFIGASVLVLVQVLVPGAVSPIAQQTRTFTGVITDDMCAYTGHASMRMGPTDAECTHACVDAHDAAYVLADGKHVYKLSDADAAKAFAGKKVKVVGTLDEATGTILVASITGA